MVKDIEELKDVSGGAIKWGILAAIGSAITFLIGVVDAYFRPLPCNK